MQGDVLDDAIALVEDAEDRDALGHWGDSALAIRGCLDLSPGRPGGILSRLAPFAACGKRQAGDRERERRAHAYSGIHGS
jgi:hypothetical protein